MKSGNFSIDDIPDIYIDGYFNDFLLDDLKNTYGISDEVIEKLEKCNYCDYDIELARNNTKYDYIDELNSICRIMRGEEKIEGMTDEEIEKFCDYGNSYGNAYIFKCIDNYNNQFELTQEYEKEEY